MHVLPTLESPKTSSLYVAEKSRAIFVYFVVETRAVAQNIGGTVKCWGIDERGDGACPVRPLQQVRTATSWLGA